MMYLYGRLYVGLSLWLGVDGCGRDNNSGMIYNNLRRIICRRGDLLITYDKFIFFSLETMIISRIDRYI